MNETSAQEGQREVYGAVRIPAKGRFSVVADTAKEQGFGFRVGIGGRKLVFKNHQEAMSCHAWLFERGVKESLKVEHRLTALKVIVLTAERELWLLRERREPDAKARRGEEVP